MNLEERVLEKIKGDQLKPKSFWYFLIKDYTLWGLVFISIILAAISIAPIIFILQNLELGYVKHLTDNIYLFILFVLPYPWLILCALTTYLTTLAWERTKNGYRFDGKKVLAGSLLVSLILGILLNIWNFGKRIDDEFGRASLGNYRSFEDRRDSFWFGPESGRFIGKITDISTSSFIILNQKNEFIKEVLFDQTTIGTENIFPENHIRIIAYENFACAIFTDNFRLGNKNKSEKDIIKFLMSSSTDTEDSRYIHEECKNIFKNGRANFKPKSQENLLK